MNRSPCLRRATPRLARTFPLTVGLLLLLSAVASAAGSARGAGMAPRDDDHPAPFTWTNGQVSLSFAGESASFWVASNHEGRSNLSVTAAGIGEIAPDGSVVAFAPFEQSGVAWSLTSSSNATAVNVALGATVQVGPASGNWNTSEMPSSVNPSLGALPVTLTFHLARATGAGGYQVKFDLALSGWPWRSGGDHLGVALSVDATGGSDLSSSGGSGSVDEASSGAPVANLTWGPTATATTLTGSGEPLAVTGSIVTADDLLSSIVRLSFLGAPGGYTQLLYDPTIALNPSAFPPVPVPAWVASPAALEVAGIGAVIVVAMALAAVRSRGRPAPTELAPPLPVPPGAGRSPASGLRLLCRRCGGPLRAPLGGVRVLTCSRCTGL